MFYKRESHMWQISVIDLLNAGEIWTRSISCGVSEGRGRGTNKKKKILRHQKFIYLCSGALPYMTLFFDSGSVLTAVFFLMYSGEYHIWSSKTSFEEFFFSAFFRWTDFTRGYSTEVSRRMNLQTCVSLGLNFTGISPGESS